MENAEKRKVLGLALREAESLLNKEMQGMAEAIKAEEAKLIAKAERQLLQAAEDEAKLSPRDQRKKDKRDLWIAGVATAGGVLLGLAVLPAIVLSVPAIAATVAPVIGGAALTGATFLLSAITGGILGYGVGQAQAYLTPYYPKLGEDQIEAFAKQAQQKVQAERIGKVVCQLRLQRTRGAIGYAELAEACEGISDIARLQHGIGEEAVRELRQTASESRVIAEKEAAEKREQEKLRLEKEKAEKQDKREEVKEGLTVKKLEQDIDLEKKVVEAKLSRSGGEEVLQKLLGGDGTGSLMPEMDMSKLMNLAMMRSVFGNGGGSVRAN